MGRPRKPSRKGWPDNLYMNEGGYFYYRNPLSGKKIGLGHDKQKSFSEARAANAVLANIAPSKLVDWVSGITEHSLKDWVPIYKTAWVEKAKLAVSTLRNQSGYLVRIQEADFAWMPLKSITTAHVALFLQKIEADSGVATVALVRSRLSDMFRMAETRGMIESGKNPVTSTYLPDYEVVRERLSLEQFIEIRAAAKPWLRNAMNNALLTAQRREDIANMKFADCREGYLYIIPGKSQGKIRLQQDMKIWLPPAKMTIEDSIKLCRDNFVSKFLVHHGKAQGQGKPGSSVSVNGLTNAFAAVRDAVGVQAAKGRAPPSFHEIRSLSERLYKEHYGAEFAQAMLGHKNAKMTATYDDLRGSGWQVVRSK